MRYLVIMLRKNELQTQQLIIPPHELPVLAYVHGEESCRVVGESFVDKDPPEPSAEFDRLAQKYGRDKANESLEPRVGAVYGQGRLGVNRLRDAIRYGQRDDVTLEDFQLGAVEPAHDTPQRTRQATQAHGTSALPPHGSQDGGAPLDRPTELAAGAADAKRAKTAKAQRAAVANRRAR